MHLPPVLRFFFTDSESAATATAAPCKKTICGTLMSSDKDYEGFFHDKDGNGKTGLRLQHTPCEETPDFNPERISFDELVSRSSELFPGDILRITANLARSILRFDCSHGHLAGRQKQSSSSKKRVLRADMVSLRIYGHHTCASARPLYIRSRTRQFPPLAQATPYTS